MFPTIVNRFPGQSLTEVYADTVVGIMAIATSGMVPNVYAQEVKDPINSDVQVTMDGVLTR
jgi:hypothetical protein